MDNITLAGYCQRKVIEAAKLIGMHDFIMRSPGNIICVMERDITLSLGSGSYCPSYGRCAT
jgi:ATP-binding cassette subfamily B protein